MKYVLKATQDIFRHIGDVRLEAKAGDEQTFNPRRAEIAMATGAFEFVKILIESETEEAVALEQAASFEEQKTELLKLGKETLTTRAKDLDGYKSSMNKEELVDLILTPRAPVTITDAQIITPEDGNNEPGE